MAAMALPLNPHRGRRPRLPGALLESAPSTAGYHLR